MSKNLDSQIPILEHEAEQLLRSIHPETSALGDPDQISAQHRPNLPRPFVIEFAGTPKAGKTTAFENLVMFLRRNGFKITAIHEKAAICNVRQKDHMFFNVWTASQTLSDLLVALQLESDVIVLDRGLFDALIWMQWLRTKGRLTQEEHQTIVRFLQLERWKSAVDLVFLLSVGPREALRREHSRFLTRKPGSIMNSEAITEFNAAATDTKQRFERDFREVIPIDTSKSDPDKQTANVVQRVLTELRSFVDEKVLVIPRFRFHAINPAARFVCEPRKLSQLLDLVETNKQYVSRVKAESDFSMVQPIVICSIRHKDELFVVRKKERELSDRMHGKYAVWVGGHVRDCDDKGGPATDTLQNALRRELDEEVLLNVNGELELVGIVWDDTSDKSQIHVGLVYELVLVARDAKLALTQKEFTELRGTSISGSFKDLTEIGNLGVKLELWSYYILRDYYRAKTLRAIDVQRSLFSF
jgi:predicted NUDIX family phosphoesterase/predicted ATPase